MCVDSLETDPGFSPRDEHKSQTSPQPPSAMLGKARGAGPLPARPRPAPPAPELAKWATSGVHLSLSAKRREESTPPPLAPPRHPRPAPLARTPLTPSAPQQPPARCTGPGARETPPPRTRMLPPHLPGSLPCSPARGLGFPAGGRAAVPQPHLLDPLHP